MREIFGKKSKASNIFQVNTFYVYSLFGVDGWIHLICFDRFIFALVYILIMYQDKHSILGLLVVNVMKEATFMQENICII